jgi:hypothetical protein
VGVTVAVAVGVIVGVKVGVTVGEAVGVYGLPPETVEKWMVVFRV